MLAEVERLATDRADRDGTRATMTAESISPEVRFDTDLAQRIVEGHGWPVIPTAAGHDAGILQSAGIPTAMLFVRNPTGISHSPDEHAEMADCLAGVNALAATFERLCADPSLSEGFSRRVARGSTGQSGDDA